MNLVNKGYKVVLLSLIVLWIFNPDVKSGSPYLSHRAPEDDSINWIPASSGRFAINGLWWFNENHGTFYRLPERVRSNKQINSGALKYAEYPSGGRIRFKTDSPFLSLKIDHGDDKFSWKELSVMAMAGIEIYEGEPGNMVFRGISRPESGLQPYIIDFKLGATKNLREYTLYLPMYSKLKTLELAFESGSRIESPTTFNIPKPLVFYGSSFIQGGCASRPSMNLPALAGRKLNADFINLGFAGDGTYEPEMADVLAEIDASCFIMGPILNDPGLMAKNYYQFVSRIRQKRPDCPIILMTRLHTLGQKEPFDVNDLVMKVFKDMRSLGDKNVFYFDSFTIYSDGSMHPTVEGLHPSDLGFMKIAELLVPVIARSCGK